MNPVTVVFYDENEGKSVWGWAYMKNYNEFKTFNSPPILVPPELVNFGTITNLPKSKDTNRHVTQEELTNHDMRITTIINGHVDILILN